jgi:hypothetical protein
VSSRRTLNISIIIATLLTLAAVIGDLAIGGRPDPPALRAAATTLDGAWRFHPGDEPRWAEPDADDTAWETIDLTASPGSHDGDVGLPDSVDTGITREDDGRVQAVARSVIDPERG